MATTAETLKSILGCKYTDFVHVKTSPYIFQDDKTISHDPDVFPESFYACKYLVTQELYEKVMGNNSSYFKGKYRPVETVSWNDANDFIAILNDKYNPDKKTLGLYRLPHEYMWEYCARSKNPDKSDLNHKSSYSGSHFLPDVGWYDQNSGQMTQPVGLKQSNHLGLYDMSGNVWEWMANNYENLSFEMHQDENPTRSLRGGSWINSVIISQVLFRYRYYASIRSDYVGFRLFRY